jgi:hypothetical protein
MLGRIAERQRDHDEMVHFDSIRKRVDDDADLVLFDEAVTCHNGGASRAAYVFAWIVAAEGLLNKLDAMGADRDRLSGRPPARQIASSRW